MARPRRSEIINPDECGVYHIYNKVVQDMYLCGVDPLTGNDYSHRKRWLLDRARELSELFCIDVGYFAVQSNHYHLILRNRPDVLQTLSDREIVYRWRRLYPHRRNRDGTPVEPTPWEIQIELGMPERVAIYRRRLGCISWFMKELQQPISRMANKEMGTKGAFWQGRFQCRRLLDDEAILACAMYVDLNEIRAGVADLPENSEYSSVAERIAGRQQRGRDLLAAAAGIEAARAGDVDYWLAPVNSRIALEVLAPAGHQTQFREALPGGSAPRRGGWLEITLDQYLTLLDWTGRELRAGKRGAISSDVAPILERLKLDAESWCRLVRSFEGSHLYAAGAADLLREFARRLGRVSMWGVGLFGRIYGR